MYRCFYLLESNKSGEARLFKRRTSGHGCSKDPHIVLSRHVRLCETHNLYVATQAKLT
jgi:hypothetical protein